MSDTLRTALKGSGRIRVSIQQGNNKDFFLEAIEDWARLTKAGRAVIKAGELAEAEDPDGLIWETLKTLVQDCHINREVRERVAALTAPQNDPLTMEELREMWKMDGDPVYLSFGGVGEWVLVQLRMNEIFFLHKNGISAPAENAFRIGGKVYRRKPEPET